jgi:phosphoribosylformimino-5-aminoimidazole carboxamide ribotide isomerase
MLIPSIDLMNGKVVQLVQGERLAIETTDIDGWVAKFEPFPRVQLIDLDAAMGKGSNSDLVRSICQRLPCRVGGGIRTLDRARAVLADGATAIIVGSALFDERGPNLEMAARLTDAVGADRLIAAIDSRGGHVVVKGWREAVALQAADAAAALEPFCGEFLYTHVDTEGLLGGIDMEAVMRVRAATSRRLTAAGGISTREEIARLDALGIDAVVGMAIYTGLLDIGDEQAM